MSMGLEGKGVCVLIQHIIQVEGDFVFDLLQAVFRVQPDALLVSGTGVRLVDRSVVGFKPTALSISTVDNTVSNVASDSSTIFKVSRE